MNLPKWNVRGPFVRTGIYVLYILGALVVWQNFSLNRTNAALRNPPAGVLPGSPLRHLAGITLDGKFKEIPDADLSKTLIITISPVCAYCTDQLPKWKSLVDDVGAKHGWHTIWISDGSPAQTKAYCDKYSIPSSDVLSYPVYMTYLELNLRSVPTTIVVKNGVISTQWFGTLKPNDWIGLRQALES